MKKAISLLVVIPLLTACATTGQDYVGQDKTDTTTTTTTTTTTNTTNTTTNTNGDNSTLTTP